MPAGSADDGRDGPRFARELAEEVMASSVNAGLAVARMWASLAAVPFAVASYGMRVPFGPALNGGPLTTARERDETRRARAA